MLAISMLSMSLPLLEHRNGVACMNIIMMKLKCCMSNKKYNVAALSNEDKNDIAPRNLLRIHLSYF